MGNISYLDRAQRFVSEFAEDVCALPRFQFDFAEKVWLDVQPGISHHVYVFLSVRDKDGDPVDLMYPELIFDTDWPDAGYLAELLYGEECHVASVRDVAARLDKINLGEV